MHIFNSFQAVYDANASGAASGMSVFNKAEDVKAVKAACATWSKAIDGVQRAVQKYNAARENYRKINEEVTLRRSQEKEIAIAERKRGNDAFIKEFEQEYREITDAQLAVRTKVDALNAIEFKY
jgi:hypothetical protein